MITVEEAREILMRHVPPLRKQACGVEEAVGHVLSDDIHALDPFPPFDMSAMDGYAIGDPAGPWQQVGRLAAGDVLGRTLRPGECVRIFTGAQVPAGSHAVVMQERCTMGEGGLIIEGEVPPPSTNIRRKAEGFAADGLIMAKGTRVNAAAVGLMASAGVSLVGVGRPPEMGIVRTGNEFIQGSLALPGHINSSNDRMLIAAAYQAGYHTREDAFIAFDEVQDIKDTFETAAREGDIVIATGGVSVGEHDLVRPALEAMSAEIHFHGVAQKPGKPMLFATLDGVPVFALPGNPRAVMVAWWEYVLPFLRAMEGDRSPWPRSERLPLADGLELKGTRAEFRAAQVRDGRVRLLPDQGSHMLSTLVAADALACFPADARELREGDLVEIHHISGR